MTHTVIIVGNRKIDNSLIYQCTKCKSKGLGLIGPCKSYGPRGRKKK